MLPAFFLTLPSLPLTPNGKIDRQALPVPDFTNVATSLRQAAKTATEKLLCEILSTVLGHTINNVLANFFDIGGHSLKAVQIVSRISQRLGKQVDVSIIFTAPIIKDLAVTIDQLAGPDTSLAFRVHDRGVNIPLSSTQQQLWFLQQLPHADHTYNMPASFKICGKLNHAALEQAFQKVVERHHALRTYIANTESGPVQRISENYQLKIPIKETEKPEINKHLETFGKHRFDLSEPLLLRLLLLQTDAEEHHLAINIHHMIADEWSLGLIVTELNRCYSSYVNNLEPDLDPVGFQFADYACWQQEYLNADRVKKLADYWKTKLKNGPELLEFPADHIRPAVLGSKADYLPIKFSKSLTTRLQKFSKQQNTTLFTTLLAMFQLLLSKYSGQNDVVVGAPNINRPLAEFERIVGLFVNTLAFRTQISNDQDFFCLLEQVKQTTREAFSHQDLPFETVVDLVNPKRSLSFSPIFQALFVLQNNPFEQFSLEGLMLEKTNWLLPSNKFDMSLFLAETPSEISGYLEYNTELFSSERMQRAMENFICLLESALATPELPVGKLAFLHPAEKQTLLLNWNKTQTELPSYCSIRQLFEVQVQKNPQATALEHRGQQLTYQALNLAAEQLADRLWEQGLRPGDLTGVYLTRTPGLNYLTTRHTKMRRCLRTSGSAVSAK